MRESAEDIHSLLCQAIRERRLLRLTYRGRERILEPHDYGIHKGVRKLFGYQVAGSSSQKLPAWRWFEVDSVSSVAILERRFRGSRPAPSGKHHHWDEIFMRVAPDDAASAAAGNR